MGKMPAFWALTAMPARVWVCNTQPAFSRAWWMALWMVKPAGLTGNGESLSMLQAWSTLTTLDQAAGGDLVEHHAVGVDLELVLRTRYACTHMREHQVTHAIGGNQAISGREVHA